MTPAEFVEKWKVSGGAETANSQLFLTELCLLLDLPAPDATTQNKEEDRYVFEKFVTLNNGDGTSSPGWADLYRSGCFVLESKQGTEKKAEELANALATRTKNAPKRKGTATRGTPGWNRAMWKAREQAKSYAEAIPGEWPPFLVVTDVGYCFDLYADFTGSGKSYEPYPDPQNFRIPLEAIEQEDVRELLRSIWLDPLSLDPSKVTSEVTSDIAERLARLAKSLEQNHEPEAVAGFLMRCLFTMFAEDVDLIPNQGFTAMLIEIRESPDKFAPMATELWKAMDEGGFSGVLRDKVPRFNGKFFSDKTAIDLNRDQLELLIEAAERDWQQVEPAIFGTMLERALDPVERHKLGAHYTPRAYVERLVVPTIIEPLREKWTATYAAAIQLDDDGK
ncbi:MULTISPECIES: type IIL restriction-modification enzyme MmeI [Rhodopirellula]|uniref:type IIL restriction-modification enzyme MmeI n=1 Tax=Rhodopirellula TaxID=265488 RepID=UPI002579BCEB|nr:type IIL restriction-modification enzyme MmeI [Rhodopirellula sp. UBA1907]|tara:strand:- start:54 stop:1232 length:1179 start_codon:yes stop_codon:yes gene_type:complete